MRRLGNSGLLVSDLALGTMVFGEGGARGTPSPEAIEMIHRYLDAGHNHIDTADVYANGRSEEIVGEALQGRREGVVLATKVRFSTGDGPNEAGLSRHHIMRGVEASLRRLRTDVVDLLYMHCWDPLTPLEESLRAFDDLVTAGKVRYIGVSNFKAWQLMKSLGISDAHGWVRFVAAQYQYSLIERSIDHEYGDLLAVEGVGLVPWSPLGGGFLSGKYRPGDPPHEGRLAAMGDEAEESWKRRSSEHNWAVLDAVTDIAGGHGCSPSRVALAWLRHKPVVVSTIIGVRTMEQLEDNLASLDCDLGADELARLDEVSAPAPGYPYRFLGVYGSRIEG